MGLRELALRHREAKGHVSFVAITGSCGKTTTKAVAAGILARHRRGTTSPGSANCGDDVAATVLRVSADDGFCLQELGAWGPGTLDAGLELIRPSVGVVLNVRHDHIGAFRTLEATAAEKAKIVATLPSDGVAILNADDPRTAAMRSPAHIVTFGRSVSADLRATEVSAGWPDRLSFRLTSPAGEFLVSTRLVGEQALGSALAALGVAMALGVPIADAVEELAVISPVARRMNHVSTANGITFIRDDFKAPSDSLPDLVRFLATAKANRTLAVIGRISDYPGRSRPTYQRFAEALTGAVDRLVFVGERATQLWGAGEHLGFGVFPTVEAASQDLAQTLAPGDLVLLKGSGPVDHLERIALGRTGPVQCWARDCGRIIGCDDCELLRPRAPVGPGVLR